jgi:hypothetical protein
VAISITLAFVWDLGCLSVGHAHLGGILKIFLEILVTLVDLDGGTFVRSSFRVDGTFSRNEERNIFIASGSLMFF